MHFTMGSDGIIDPILHFCKGSSGIIDPVVGSTSMSGRMFSSAFLVMQKHVLLNGRNGTVSGLGRSGERHGEK